MILYTSFDEISRPYGLLIGNYDGVHTGHQDVLKEFVKACEKQNLLPVLLTFKEHPKFFFQPQAKNFKITSNERKRSLLFQFGLTHLVEFIFDKNLQKHSAREFLEQYIFNQKNLKFMALGHDFALGSGKEDSLNLCKELASQRGVPLSLHKSFMQSEQVVSSTLIRNLLDKGELSQANKFLGRNYVLEGQVVRGKQIGSKELVPTINLNFDPRRKIPKVGVYATLTKIDGRYYHSITNIGHNPTVSSGNLKTVETFILDFSKDVYNLEVSIEFLEFIREEKKFDSLDKLGEQIKLDVEKVKNYFKKINRPHLALVGKNIKHSQSQNIYERLLNKSISYDLLDYASESEIASADELLKKYDGFSITAPYKTHFLSESEVTCDYKKAVNTVYKKESNIYSTNTDLLGCEEILLKLKASNILVLGDGAMAKMIEFLGTKLGISVKLISRKNELLDKLDQFVKDLPQNSLVINSCSRSYDFKFKTNSHLIVWDLNYNADSASWFSQFSNIQYFDGIGLLELQAKYALKHWNFDSK